MFLHLSRYDLLTTLAALQQARAYRRHSKRYVRKDLAAGKTSEEVAAGRIAHADLIAARYTELAVRIVELLDAGDQAKISKARKTRRQESKDAVEKVKDPQSPARHALHKLIAARREKKDQS